MAFHIRRFMLDDEDDLEPSPVFRRGGPKQTSHPPEGGGGEIHIEEPAVEISNLLELLSIFKVQLVRINFSLLIWVGRAKTTPSDTKTDYTK